MTRSGRVTSPGFSSASALGATSLAEIRRVRPPSKRSVFLAAFQPDRQPNITVGIRVASMRLAVDTNLGVAGGLEEQNLVFLSRNLQGQVASRTGELKHAFGIRLDASPVPGLAIPEGDSLVFPGHRPSTGDELRGDRIQHDRSALISAWNREYQSLLQHDRGSVSAIGDQARNQGDQGQEEP